MSIYIASEVWEHSRSTGTARLVLLALADNADRASREAWPSVRDLADRTKVSERTVQRALRELEAIGEIECVARGGVPRRPTRYRVAGRQAVTPGRGDSGDRVGRHLRSSEGDTGGTRTVKREPSQEPSPPKSPCREHPDLHAWLDHHEATTNSRPPRPGTAARRDVAAAYSARRAEGYSADDLTLATVGAFNDPFRRENGHYGTQSVLRPGKVHDLIEKARRGNASAAGGRAHFDRMMER